MRGWYSLFLDLYDFLLKKKTKEEGEERQELQERWIARPQSRRIFPLFVEEDRRRGVGEMERRTSCGEGFSPFLIVGKKEARDRMLLEVFPHS